MSRRTWCTAVHGVARESDVTDCTRTHPPTHNLSLNLAQVKALILTRIIIDEVIPLRDTKKIK